MDVVLLDLGNTLIDAHDEPLPGARELLTVLRGMTGASGQPLQFRLVSDWEMSDDPDQRILLAKQYYELLARTIWNSDYIPFEERGYACVGVYEASENPGYHTTRDVLKSLDMHHLAEVAKLVVASVNAIAR